MKVLVINGSPRGEESNTMVLTRAFLAGAGWPDAEVIDLTKVKVRGCLGCFACWAKTPGACVMADDMGAILPKLVAADVVIWSFPLYYYNVPGDLKNFIDRQLPLVLPEMTAGSESGDHPSRYDMRHQRHILISTCGYWTPSGNYHAVTAMFDRMFGRGTYASIFCGQGALFQVAQVEEIPDLEELKKLVDDYMTLLRRAGEEFAVGEISAQTKRALEEPILPQDVYEEQANASWR